MKFFSATCAIAILLLTSCSADDSSATSESLKFSKTDNSEMYAKTTDTLREGDPVKPKTKD